MKISLFILSLCVFGNCGSKNSKFVRKKIIDNNITIRWYYYSYISDVSPDIVEVEKDGEIKKIYEAIQVITNVLIKEKRIILKLVEPTTGLVFTQKVQNKIFDYKIVLDTTGSYTDLRNIPDGIKE